MCRPCTWRNALAEVMDDMDNCNHEYVVTVSNKLSGVQVSNTCALCGYVRGTDGTV